MEVRVENNESNPWFLDTRGDPCRPIRTVPPPEVLDGFFARFRAVIEAGNPGASREEKEESTGHGHLQARTYHIVEDGSGLVLCENSNSPFLH